MPPTSFPHRCAVLLAVIMLLSLPVRLAADLVWTPAGGWKIEGGVTSGLSGKDATAALDLMNQARAEEEQTSYFSALRDYKRITNDYPSSIYAPEAYYRMATIRIAREQYVKAFKAFQEIVSRYPGTPRFNEVIGRQFRLACDLLDGVRGRNWLGISTFRNREASVGFFEQIVTNAPYGEYAPLALMCAARAHQYLHDPEEAIDALDRMINTYPKSVLASGAYLRSAQVHASIVQGPHYDQSSTKEAITYFEDFMILFPGDANIAVAEKGLADMKEMLAESKIKIGDYYLQHRENYKAAKVFYNEAITDYPDSPVAGRARAQLVKVDALLAEQEKAAAAPAEKLAQPQAPKKKWFLFF